MPMLLATIILIIVIGNTVEDGPSVILRNATIAVPLKYLSDFWRSLEMPLINRKVELKLKCSNHYVLSANGDYNADADPTNIIFSINDIKLYVPLVILSAKDNQKLAKHFIKGYKVQSIE